MSNYQYYGKHQWVCRLCMKTLSSKRSFDEHMNIHNKSRPFGCDECNYAAASKMTLRRHKLRNHIPRSSWGYQCPYCGDFYMEPASYQQHITVRHWGLSATFGCPYKTCDFSSKSSRFFREHLIRHQVVICNTSTNGTSSSFNINLDNLSSYLINDECGTGVNNNNNSLTSNKNKRSKFNYIHKDICQTQQNKHKVVHRFIYSNAIRKFKDDEEYNGSIQRVAINVEKLLDEDELAINSEKCNSKHLTPSKPVKFRPYSPSQFASETSNPSDLDNITSSYQFNNFDSIDWIETEVTIDNELTRLPDGQTDDFGLD